MNQFKLEEDLDLAQINQSNDVLNNIENNLLQSFDNEMNNCLLDFTNGFKKTVLKRKVREEKLIGAKRKRSSLSKESKQILLTWLHEHKSNPYPTEEQKEELSLQTSLSRVQVDNWFVNARKRYLKAKEEFIPPNLRSKLELKEVIQNKWAEAKPNQ